ncbi:MAG: hypothetical protein AABY22_22130 [Nanoarchaeota archaeon]
MLKFHVTCNIKDAPFSSSSIIVNGLNSGAKNLNLYDENGINVHYSHLCESHGKERDVFISLYELNFPQFILNNAQNKPIIGSSRDNMFFILNGGYNSQKCGFVTLGIDSKLWKLQEKRFLKHKFVFLSYCDSNTRCGFLHLIHAFGKAFKNSKDIVLFLKDRYPTDKFISVVKELANFYNINIIHHIDNIDNWKDQIDIYASADAHIFVNHSSTNALTVLQGLSCGLLTACMLYSGPRDYCSEQNVIPIPFEHTLVSSEKLTSLEEYGLRNYLFKSGYTTQPFWAEPKLDSLSQILIEIKENKNKLNYLITNGRKMAEELTWECAALNMNYEAEKLLNN